MLKSLFGSITNNVSPINIGYIPAFKIQIKNKEPLYFLNIINVLRINKIIAFPSGEGTEIAGFLEHRSQIEILKKFGIVTIGLPKENTSSYIYYDKEREIGIIGCTAIIAAYRGYHINNIRLAWQITDRKTKKTLGQKKTEIAYINDKDIFTDVITKYSKNNLINPEVFHPIRRYSDLKTLETHIIHDGFIIKIDVNNFSKNLISTPDGLMKTFLKSHILFFNKIEDEIRKYKMPVLFSERTTDSLELYINNDTKLLKKISKILNSIQKNENLIKIKAINLKIKNTKLTSLNNRVLLSNKPVSNGRVQKAEQKIKKIITSFKKPKSVASWDYESSTY